MPSPRPIRGYAVVRAGLITIAWPFLLAGVEKTEGGVRGSVSKQMVINALKHAGVEIEAIRRLVRQVLKPFITRKKKPRQHWGRGGVGVLAGAVWRFEGSKGE